MNSMLLERAQKLYPSWEQQARKQVEEQFIQVLCRQLEGDQTLYTPNQYVVSKQAGIVKVWNSVWKHVALQRFTREERYQALLAIHDQDKVATKAQQQDAFIALLQNLLHWELAVWVEDFVHAVDYQTLCTQAQKEYEERKKKRRYQQLQQSIVEAGEALFIKERSYLYKQAEQHIAKWFVRDLSKYVKRISSRSASSNIPLKKGDPFLLRDYPIFGDFLDEYTGETRKWHWDRVPYHTYYDRYEERLEDFLQQLIMEAVLREIDEDRKEKAISHELQDFIHQLDSDMILDSLQVHVSEATEAFLEELAETSTDKLVQLALQTAEGKRFWSMYCKKTEALEKKRQQEQEMMEALFHDEFSFTSSSATTNYILHVGPTNSGKTYSALQRLKQAESGLYMAPLRLLALEVYQTLNDDRAACHLKTGEEERYVNGATITSCTIEVAHLEQFYEVAVIDEAQMIEDKERGFSWYRAITKTKAKEVHIILAPHARGVIEQLLEGKQVKVIQYAQSVPLVTETVPFKLTKARAGDAIVVFSRNRVLQTASLLEQQGHRVSVIYGNMPPETRQAQMTDFLTKQTDIVVSTDAIGMGLNLPIRRVVFLETTKFDGTMRRNVTSQEVKQIGGRAGRKGLYDKGFVAAAENVGLIRQALLAKDEPITAFTIKPTTRMLKEYASLSQDLAAFFEIWENFSPSVGMMKADLTQERELYEEIKDTVLTKYLSAPELYRYLSMPFSHYEKELRNHWKLVLHALVRGEEIPEPDISGSTLEELEQNYKKIGLHLLFLYSLDMRREAHLWERERQHVATQIQSYLKTKLHAHTAKVCKSCKKPLSAHYRYDVCSACYKKRKFYNPKFLS